MRRARPLSRRRVSRWFRGIRFAVLHFVCDWRVNVCSGNVPEIFIASNRIASAREVMFALARRSVHSYLADMRFSAVAIFISVFALTSAGSLRAQALQVDSEEFKRLAGEVADLRDANMAQQRRIATLQKEVENLREALRESQERTTSRMGDLATREDLKKIVEQIKAVDQQREADRKLILQEFENLGKTLAGLSKPAKRREPEPEAAAEPFEGEVIEHVVLPNESLSEIQMHYNAALQKQGRPTVSLKQILQANPKLNPNRIFAGQKINLPVPEKKK